MVTGEQRAEFEETGILKLTGAFDADAAVRMQAVLWDELRRRYDIEREDPATWDRHLPVGFKTAKRHRAFAPILGPVVQDALSDLLGSWEPPRHFGQVLMTMPNASTWHVPHKLWHTDFGYGQDDARLFGVKLWVCIDTVEPGGGGTPQLLGSHRLMRRYLEDHRGEDYKAIRDGFMRSAPWLRELASPPERRTAALDAGAEIDGIRLRVLECTGAPGDVYVTHPWVMHTIAANASARPRVMRSLAIYREGCKYH